MPRQRTRIPVVCAICSTIFEPKPSRRQRYCGQTCSIAARRLTSDDRARLFWSRVDQSEPDGCWPWTAGTRNKKGYGGFWDGRRWAYTHRVAYTLTHGVITDDLIVCHRCDNPPCCNPAHLFLGTPADNMTDKAIKGRSKNGSRSKPESRPRGEHHGNAKITADIVVAIRERYAAGGVSHQRLADEYGLFRTTVTGIINRSRWSHVQ